MKQVFKLVKFFLVILLVSFTSCTNDLSEKNKEISFSFELPQEKINRATNENSDNTLWNINAQIENTKDIIQKIEKTAYGGETVTLTFKEIIVGQEVKINIELTKKDEKTPTYTGSSDWFIVKNGNNKINLILNKVEENTPQIIDATIPEIITQPQSIVEIATPNSTTITKTLSVSAKSTDNGTLSFIWQEKNSDGNWENIPDYTTSTTNGQTSCSIDVTVNKGQSRTFKCIITNTNNSVNGNTTATVETNLVTVAYVVGELTSITAKYIGSNYEKYGNEDFYTDEKVTVTETYKSGDTQTEVKVTAEKSRYTIARKNEDEKAIGFVPYTVKYISDDNISTEIKVPVKYELKAEDFSITSNTNQSETNVANNPEKIAQFTGNTVLEVKTSATSNIPNKIYENKDENSATAEDYDILQSLQSVWKLENQQITDTAVNNAVATSYNYINTLTVPTENSWCFGGPIELEYYVQVCTWTLVVKQDTSIIQDLTNLTGNTTYTLSATNEAVANPTVTWSSNNTSFTIINNKLTTPQASTSDQTATITAKVDNNKEVGSVKVTVKTSGGTGGSGTTYSIGDLYSQNNTPMGVVFEVTDAYIKIVALKNSDNNYMFAKSGKLDTSDAIYFSYEDEGSENYMGLVSLIEAYSNNIDIDISDFPAFYYCYNYYVNSSEDELWYVPAIDELISIVQTNYDVINNTLKNNNYDEIYTNYGYWSSTMKEYTQKAYYCTKTTSGKQTNDVTTSKVVRAITKIYLTD